MAASRKKIQYENDKTPDYAAIGDMLQDTRQSYNLSVEQVALALHVKPAVISALEKGALETIPGGVVYAKGHLRSYAQYLGVNLNTMLSLLTVETEIQPVASVSSSHSEPRRTRMAVYISLCVIIGIGVAWMLQGVGHQQPGVPVLPVPAQYGAYLEEGDTPGLSSPCIGIAHHPAWPPCFRAEETAMLKRLKGKKYLTVMQVGK